MRQAKITLLTFVAVLLAIFSIGALVVPYLIDRVEVTYLSFQADENARRAKELAQFSKHRLGSGATKQELAAELQSYLAGADAERGYSCVVDQESTNFICHPMEAALGMSVAAKRAHYLEFSEGNLSSEGAPWEEVIAVGKNGSGGLIYPDEQTEVVHMITIPDTTWTISTHENTTLMLAELESLRKGILWGSVLLGLALAVPAAIAARLVSVKYERQIEGERQRSEKLLLNILPPSIAERLKSQDDEVIADHHDDVTVLFADLSGFTSYAAASEPEEVLILLNGIFTAFDDIAERYGLEKIKTIGDAYMLCGGLGGGPVSETAGNALLAAREMIGAVDEINICRGQEGCRLRVGMHTGPVVAGVIGKHKFSYDLWGSTVNMASRLEGSGVSGAVLVSDQTREILPQDLAFEERSLNLKGIGPVRAWLLGPEV